MSDETNIEESKPRVFFKSFVIGGLCVVIAVLTFFMIGGSLI
ncbi:MAG: hypothetical protein AAF677_16275 [Pseudomonadota bacterium]